MRVAIIGSAGKAGSRIAAEASARGHEVVGFGRSREEGVDVVKDVFAIERSDLDGFDAVVDALGFFTPETLPNHTSSLMRLADALAGGDTRLLVVGGAGSLYVDEEQQVPLYRTEGFPAEFAPLAAAQAEQLEALRGREDVRWTYVSPAADFQPEGERKGEYALAGERFETDAEGRSQLSYADYAIAMVDELERGEHVGERISIRWK